MVQPASWFWTVVPFGAIRIAFPVSVSGKRLVTISVHAPPKPSDWSPSVERSLSLARKTAGHGSVPSGRTRRTDIDFESKQPTCGSQYAEASVHPTYTPPAPSEAATVMSKENA